MKEFMLLIGQIILISCIQSLVEIFIEPDKKPMQARIINIACYVGSFYLLIQYVIVYVLREIVSVVKIPF